MAGEEAKPAFWSTLPGLITAVAALLTAIGGLVATLAALGVFSGTDTAVRLPPRPWKRQRR